MTTPSKRSKPSARDANPADSEPHKRPSIEASPVTGHHQPTPVDPGEDAAPDESTVEIESQPAAPVTLELSVSATPIVPGPLDAAATLEVKPDPDDDATMIHPVPPSRPRRTTLAMAITRPPIERSSVDEPPEPKSSNREERNPPVAAGNALDAASYALYPPVPGADAPPPELLDEVDEWSIADQPTIYLSPHLLTSPKGRARPPQPPVEPPPMPWATPSSFPVRGGVGSQAEREAPPPSSAPPQEDEASFTRVRRVPPPTTTARPTPGASTGGRPQPAPLRDPHMERFQYLREGRIAHQEGGRGPGDSRPVADMVRQWWHDLRPGLDTALTYQREARASGAHPIPAHEATPSSRLGDAFGRLAASARGFTGRAQSAMAPKITRLQELHAQAETAASALVQKLETPVTRQQAPLLGPGRIAVFFKQGVTVGQAQSLLGASRARPIRLIPRKHGFLALVAPGTEAEVSIRLREHPYVRDVAYLEYNEFGEAIHPR